MDGKAGEGIITSHGTNNNSFLLSFEEDNSGMAWLNYIKKSIEVEEKDKQCPKFGS